MHGNARRVRQRVEFGDFQTPRALARQVCQLIRTRKITPAAIVEPTCGQGNLLAAALDAFPNAKSALGVELNPQYAAMARELVSTVSGAVRCQVSVADFFSTDWPDLLSNYPDPLLVMGNPPWVTNAALGSLGSSNLPEKSNFQGHSGWDALTGKSNFDISEWMLLRLLESLDGRTATLAMLCKTAVARKVLAHAWTHDISIRQAEMHRIDAREHFGAAVDAGLLVCSISPTTPIKDCITYELGSDQPGTTFGMHDGILVADADAYMKWRHLAAPAAIRWRSGIKHDCSRVMELFQDDGFLRNGLGEHVQLEDTYLFPLLKSSDLAPTKGAQAARQMLVTQRQIGEDTATIESVAPHTWSYLCGHAELLDRRRSSIYRNRPRFSVFGVGSYSFAPWKVAISGFYKSLRFTVVGPRHGKPTVVDDTVYFLPCRTEQEAKFMLRLVDSEPAQELLSALVFWDAKRPVTIQLLGRLDLRAVADELGIGEEYERYARTHPWMIARKG